MQHAPKAIAVLIALAGTLGCEQPTGPAAPAASGDAQAAHSQVQGGGFRLVELGTLGGEGGEATAVAGEWVAGIASNAAGRSRAFRWSATAGMVELSPPLPSGISAGYGVNASGMVVGVGWTAAGYRALIWPVEGGVVELPGGEALAFAISETRWVAGRTVEPGFSSQAVRWSPSGEIEYLGTLGGTQGFAAAVNDEGHVVGGSTDGLGRYRSFIWTPQSGMTDLEIPGQYSSAAGINQEGVIVGYTWGSTAADYGAYRWTETGGVEWLQTRRYASVQVRDVNDAGEAVGLMDGDAVFWSSSGPPRPLPTGGGSGGGSFARANAISLHGDIVGSTSWYDQQKQAWIGGPVLWRRTGGST